MWYSWIWETRDVNYENFIVVGINYVESKSLGDDFEDYNSIYVQIWCLLSQQMVGLIVDQIDALNSAYIRFKLSVLWPTR